MTRLIISAAVGAALLGSGLAAAQTPQERGYAIAERSDKSDAGFGSSTVRLTMTLRDARGRETVREMRIDTLEKEGDGNGDRSLTMFFSPPDVDGTALLSHAKIIGSDDQWLYLPGLRRVKRISSSNKSGPFVGSEFAFEDLTANELGKFDYTYLETKVVDGMEMDIVECVPRYERSGYTKILCYFDTEIFQPRRLEFYDRGERLLKTQVISDFRQYGAGYWRPHRQEMENHLTGKSTTLEFGDFNFGVALNERDFEPSALDRL